MTIVHCPRCRDEVTVPPRAGARALVRCPLCLEQYLLAEAMANAPPLLVIIGGEVETAALAPADEATEYRVSLPASVVTRGPSTTGVVLPRPVLQTRARPRRKEKSGLVLLVNYVVGGVMGLALGLLVLWWGFRRDPLELGPSIARYVPWIVPVQFQGAATGRSATTSTMVSGNQQAVSTKRDESANDLHALLDVHEPTKLPEEVIAAAEETNEQTSKRPMPDLTDLLPNGPFENVAPSP